MLKHINLLLNTECLVVDIGGEKIYPIFRVGSSSLRAAAEENFTNKQISELSHVNVLLRDPEKRFSSGVNYYCHSNGLQLHDVYGKIKKGELVDRHFTPQFLWLMHLYKHFKGEVSLLPFNQITRFTSEHRKKLSGPKHPVDPIENFIEVDRRLCQHIGKTLPLKNIITELKNVLS